MLAVVRICLSFVLIFVAAVLLMFQHGEAPRKSRLQPVGESYRSELSWVNSISEARMVAWSYIQRQSGTSDERIVAGVDAFVRDRFSHGISHVAGHENWILAAAGGVPPFGLNVPVDVDSILQHRHAMCSQQSIVFMQLLENFGMHYAAVRFSWPNEVASDRGHFAVAAKVDGIWRYYDSDLEAAYAPPVREILNGRAIERTYPGHPWWVPHMKVAALQGTILMDSVDAHPGPRGLFVQRLTKLLSLLTPLILAIIATLVWPGVFEAINHHRQKVGMSRESGVRVTCPA